LDRTQIQRIRGLGLQSATAVLIDPAGKVISLDLQDQFRGENLSKTLESHSAACARAIDIHAFRLFVTRLR